MDPNLETAAIIISEVTQPFEGASLRVIYLVERVCYQLVGKDVPWVPLDPPQFVLTLLSMTDAEYQLWRVSIPYAKHLINDMEYDEFSETRLMPTLIQEVCNFFSPFSFILLFLYFYT